MTEPVEGGRANPLGGIVSSDQFVIHLFLYEGKIRIVPNKFLGESLFLLYKSACEKANAIYGGTKIGFVTTIDNFHNVTRALLEVGFRPNATPSLEKVIASKNPLPSVQKAKDWIELVHEEFKKQGITLREYQEYASRLLHMNHKFLLLDKPGVGKTIEALAAIPSGRPVLIICPAIAKELVWAQEIRKVRPKYKISVISGNHNFRWPKPGEAVILNYDILPKAMRIKPYPAWGIRGHTGLQLLSHICHDIKTQNEVSVPFRTPAPPGLVFIADEIQNLMNLGTGRAKSFRGVMDLVKKSQDAYAWGLTGTPLDKNPMQLWNLLCIYELQAEAYRDFGNFLRIFQGTQTGFGVRKSKKTGKIYKGYSGSYQWAVIRKGDPVNQEAVEGLQRISISRAIEDVAEEVPPITYKDIYLDIDKETYAKCDKLVADLKRRGVSIDQAIMAAINSSGGGIPFPEISAANKMLAIAKMPMSVEFIQPYIEAQEPLLFFSMYVDPLTAYADDNNWRFISGKVTTPQRTKIINDFKAGKFNCLSLSILAAGVALSLERAAFSFFNDFAYTPAANEQAIMRIRRMSQRRKQFIFRFIANHPLDRRKIELLDQREATIETTTDAARIKTAPKALTDPQMVVLGSGVISIDPRSYHISVQARRHIAESPREVWIAEKLRQMANLDEDLATEVNKVGFSASDTRFGQSLAKEVPTGLTDRTWLAAERLLERYKKQIGSFDEPLK